MKSSIFPRLLRSCRAATIAELIVATAVTSVLAAGLLTGVVTLQRSFRASHHHAKSQIEQMRLLNYISRDLRRALSVKVDTFEGAQRLTLTVPDYYDSSGRPRDPIIQKGTVQYGNAAFPVKISYYKSGATMFRSVNGAPTALATNVNDFLPNYTDSGKQSVGVSVSFVPKYQISGSHVSALRNGTATYATTLLRNKRNY